MIVDQTYEVTTMATTTTTTNKRYGQQRSHKRQRWRTKAQNKHQTSWAYTYIQTYTVSDCLASNLPTWHNIRRAGPSFSPHTHLHTLSHTHSPPTLPQCRPALPSLSFFYSLNPLRTHTLAPDPLPFALIFLALVCLLSPYPRCPDCDFQCFLHAHLTKPQKEKREALGSIYKELERYMNRTHK